VTRLYKETSDDHVKYLGVIFGKSITWRLYIEMTEAKALRTFVTNYSLFRIQRLSANIKLNLHRARIRSVMAYACRACELAADTYLLKFQRLQNKIFRTTENFPRCTASRDFTWLPVFLMDIKVMQATRKVIQIHKNEHIGTIRSQTQKI
jgi:hypothetical protein